MEIERKFLIRQLPSHMETFAFHRIEQAYLNVNPVVRVRREDDTYYLTYKGSGMMAREEYNLPLTKEAYMHLVLKADGRIICKKRYLIPFEKYTIELDVFEGGLSGLLMAEVEFPSVEAAEHFDGPAWFGTEVTCNPHYHNSFMSLASQEELKEVCSHE